MTRGDPLDGDHEVLSYGSDDPPRRPPPLLVALAAVLAVGLGATLLVRESRDAAAPDAVADHAAPRSGPEVIRVAAGSVGRSAIRTDGAFWLSLVNRGDERVVVELAALPGWPSTLTGTRATPIEPRTWEVLRFSAPVADCDSPPGEVRVAVLRVVTERGVLERPVPLAEPADDLMRRHHAAVCAHRRSGP